VSTCTPLPLPLPGSLADTIEDKILELQERKRATIATALGEGAGAGGLAAFNSRLTPEEVRQLFAGM